MCGIAAFFFYPMQRPPEMWAEIRDIFTKNLLHNEERGRLATGVAIVQKDGTFDRFKKPVSAAEFINEPQYHHILAALSGETTCLLGHTREPTKGEPHNNLNNHPLIIDNHIGVHNGQISNDDTLFQERKFPRLAEVDSEIIFHLFNAVHPAKFAYPEEITEQARLLKGTFATISIDLRDPSSLIVIKYKRPLCLHYHEPWKAIIFSSRYIFLRKAFGKAVVTEALESGNLFYFRAKDMLSNKHLPTDNYSLT